MLQALGLVLTLTFVSSDGSTLAGTLSFPAGAPVKVPAVVLVGGNGPLDRTQPVGATPVFDLYAQALNAAGFAVLRYDTRGVGSSTTKTESHAVRRQNFIDDAAAAVRAAAADPRIDPERVFALGLSEGAETVMAAALGGAPLRGLIFVGPLSVPYADAMAEQDKNQPAEVRDRDVLLMALPYFQSYEGVDPRREITLVQQPMLVLRGLADRQTPAVHFDALAAAAQTAKRRVTVRRFPGADHFLLSLTPAEVRSGGAYQLRHELDPVAAAAIVTWLRQQ